jgi:hypothetical protein
LDLYKCHNVLLSSTTIKFKKKKITGAISLISEMESNAQMEGQLLDRSTFLCKQVEGQCLRYMSELAGNRNKG